MGSDGTQPCPRETRDSRRSPSLQPGPSGLLSAAIFSAADSRRGAEDATRSAGAAGAATGSSQGRRTLVPCTSETAADRGNGSDRPETRQKTPQDSGCIADAQLQPCSRIDAEVAAVKRSLTTTDVAGLSAHLHRLAGLAAASPNDAAALRREPSLTALLSAIHVGLVREQWCGGARRGYVLSNVAWSLASLRLANQPLLEVVAAHAHRHANAMNPQELTTVLWAFAKLGSIETSLNRHAAPLFQYAADHVPGIAGQFTFRCLVMVAWSSATVGRQYNRLLHGVAEPLVPGVRTASCQELTSIAWAFSTAGVSHDKLFAEVAGHAARRVGDFQAQDLSSLISSFAAAGFVHAGLLDAASAAAEQLTDLRPGQLANVLRALSQSRPRHPATCSALLALLQRYVTTLDTFKPLELSSVALAAARAFGRPIELGGASLDVGACKPPPPQVAEFFAAAMPLLVPRLRCLSGQSLANVATSFLQVRGGDAGLYVELLAAIGHEVINRSSALETPLLLSLLRDLPGASTSECGAAMRALLQEAHGRIDALQPTELQTLSSICASLLGCPSGALSKEMLRGCCHSLAKASMWDAPRRQSTCSSEAPDASSAEDDTSVGHPSSGTGGHAREARPKWATPTASNASTCGDEEEAEAKRMAASGLRELPWGYCVKNTFVDLDVEGDCFADGATPATALGSIPIALGAPLDIIPPDISQKKLEAYRLSYQRFRVGNPAGAKGELTSIST